MGMSPESSSLRNSKISLSARSAEKVEKQAEYGTNLALNPEHLQL
jgi:hypothetical protein